MSNRSLFEINHDYSHVIERRSDEFLLALNDYLRSANPRSAEVLETFGVRVFGMRHHSDAFDISWGGITAVERDYKR